MRRRPPPVPFMQTPFGLPIPNKIKIRVWERGVGETLACGSGACASVYAGYVKGLNNNYCEVIFKKGSLFIEINNNNEVIMTGPADISFFGSIDL